MQRLKAYRSVGWDFDGTIFDHINSEMFARFIKENPFQQDFHIVTFRSHGMQHEIDRDLAAYDLDRSAFVSVVNVSDEMFEAYHRARNILDPQPLWDYHTWKGKVCKELGAGLLIDDMADLVLDGCAHYDVDYLHPDHLTPL